MFDNLFFKLYEHQFPYTKKMLSIFMDKLGYGFSHLIPEGEVNILFADEKNRTYKEVKKLFFMGIIKANKHKWLENLQKAIFSYFCGDDCSYICNHINRQINCNLLEIPFIGMEVGEKKFIQLHKNKIEDFKNKISIDFKKSNPEMKFQEYFEQLIAEKLKVNINYFIINAYNDWHDKKQKLWENLDDDFKKLTIEVYPRSR